MNSRKGFTMIELLVVLALIIVIAAAVIFNLGSFNTKQNLEAAVNSLVAVIRDVQQRSVTQQDGQQWGLRFYNTDSDRYDVFKGVSYASGTLDKLYTFRHGIRFSEPTASSSFDIVFQALTGKITNPKIISLINNRGDGFVGDIILNQTGLVTSRIEKDVVGYWHLDEGTSTVAYDASGLSDRDGTIAGASWQIAANCKGGGCLSFDGTDDAVSIDLGPLDLAGDFSVVFWVNKNNKTTDNDRFISLIDDADNGFQFIADDATQKYGIFLKRDGVSAIDQLTYGNIVFGSWIHLAYVVSAGSGTFYNNGAAVASDGSTTIALAGAGYHIGKRADSQATTFLSGKIDEVRFYDRALTGTEILNFYNDLK